MMAGKDNASVISTGKEARIINGHKDTALCTKKNAPVFDPGAFISGATSETSAPSIEEISKNIFVPDWDNKPQDVKAIVKLNDISILTYQNSSMLVAAPGFGKSSICEALCASFLNPSVDCLGLSVDPECGGVIFIDNERTDLDVWNSFNRMNRRAGIPYGVLPKGVKIAGLRSVPRLEERLSVIEHLLDNNPCGLLIIDGLGDLVTDSNDLAQAIECRIWLREITVKYKVAIFLTIHPNPYTNKPRGHVGSEGHREAECVLLAKNMGGDVRILTTDFEHGKNRNSSHVSSAYRWSEDSKMFISTDIDDALAGASKGAAKQTKAENLANKVLSAPKALTHTELVDSICEATDCKESTAKSRIKDMIDYKLIKKHDDGFYRSII